MQLEDAKVVGNEATGQDYWLMSLDSPGIAGAVKPGQFVHIQIPNEDSLVLRRPFSVFKAEEGMLRILYKNVGQGTAAMRSFTKGQIVSLMGPLGNGFPLKDTGAYPVLVAGGYGVAALYMLAANFSHQGTLVVGGKSKKDVLCTPDFEALGWDVQLVTEDGSLGQKGVVTDLLDGCVKHGAETGTELYACGPDGMLNAVARYAAEQGMTSWVSMDCYMGCGAGACLTCVHKIRDEDGVIRWKRTCKDGPVFEGSDVVWSEPLPARTNT